MQIHSTRSKYLNLPWQNLSPPPLCNPWMFHILLQLRMYSFSLDLKQYFAWIANYFQRKINVNGSRLQKEVHYHWVKYSLFNYHKNNMSIIVQDFMRLLVNLNHPCFNSYRNQGFVFQRKIKDWLLYKTQH